MSFEFYATVPHQHVNLTEMPPVNYLLSASSTWAARKRLVKPPLPPGFIRAIDCGGYTAATRWKRYPYTPEIYTAWLAQMRPEWAATFDYCCEPNIAADQSEIEQRQRLTTENAHYFWRTFRGERWSWTVSWDWIPTIQGWHVEDYQRHARTMKPLIEDMAAAQSAAFRVGIGTLCTRANVSMVTDVVDAVRAELPGLRLHLWGVKIAALPRLDLDNISCDTNAWDLHGLHQDGVDTRLQRLAAGKTQSQWRFKKLLPEYIEKVERLVMRTSINNAL